MQLRIISHFWRLFGFHSPHTPIVYDPGHGGQYKGKPGSAYYGSISGIDHEMGRLQAHLAELGIAENTFVAYTSDNGPERGQAGITGGLRARKRSLYEGGYGCRGLSFGQNILRRGK